MNRKREMNLSATRPFFFTFYFDNISNQCLSQKKEKIKLKISNFSTLTKILQLENNFNKF